MAEAASSWLDARLKESQPKEMKIIKPAAGYASCPDHTLKQDILELLPAGNRLEIKLTESFAMMPESCICGMIFMHPDAKYPDIRRISQQQYDDYSHRRGMDELTARRFLGHLLK
jgi:5-methyltetrahydrofolate--homocysteine methyltransferase